MNRDNRYNLLLRLCVFLLAAGLFAAGLSLRLNPNRTPFISSNVDTFYFHRSEILVSEGSFPKYDKWGFAPEVFPENTPPALGYASLAGFSLWRTFGGPNDFVIFANYFPVFIYGAWFLCVLVMFLALGASLGQISVILALVALTPAAADVTQYGRYFEENIGVPLLFLSAVMFMHIRRVNWVFWLGIASATFFVLSWQAFPFFYAAALASAVFSFAIAGRDLKKLALRLAMLAAPLVIAEGLVRLFVKNSYSAFAMIWEIALAFWHRSSPEISTAMHRGDWANAGWSDFINWFGHAGIFVLIAGVLGAALWLKEKRPRAADALFFGLAGIALAVLFRKFRHFSVGLFAVPWILGTEVLSSPGKFFEDASRCFKALIRFFGLSRRFFIRLAAAAALAAAGAVSVYSFWFYFLVSDPLGAVSVSSERLGDGLETVEIRLTNSGGSTSRGKKAFAGLHIAVEGGEVLRSKPFSGAGGLDAVRGLGTKDFAQWGRTYFFEVSYPRIKSGESAGVELLVQRTGGPLKIYHRGWLPKYRCSLKDRREGMKNLREAWRNMTQGWRNEKCIVRIPANDDATASFCPTKVFAAHEELQDFRCGASELL